MKNEATARESSGITKSISPARVGDTKILEGHRIWPLGIYFFLIFTLKITIKIGYRLTTMSKMSTEIVLASKCHFL